MNLYELAFGCHVYAGVTDYDQSYRKFLEATIRKPDLSVAEHRTALLRWLNKWGCRQFDKDHHDDAAKEILTWYSQCNSKLIPPDQHLWELTDADLAFVKDAYEDLSKRTVGYKLRNGKFVRSTIGPTGTAKILFAIRPKAFIPWDDAIREKHRYDSPAYSYLAYLKQVKNTIGNLQKACQVHFIEVTDLPRLFGRLDSTVVKLIDEYYWVTLARKCSPPPTDTLRLWIDWNG